MPDLARPWRVLLRRVLSRKLPHTLFSWRFMLPCEGAIGLHRQVFFRAWPELPRLLYAGLVLYSLVLWFGYQGWVLMARAYRRHASEVFAQQGTSRLRQFGHLLVVVGRGIPPHRYYAMQLYRVIPAQWWDFVFDHELPHWHIVMQGKPASRRTRRLLADKRFFESCLREKGLEVVPTLFSFMAGDLADWSALQQRDLFFKPVSASRAEGCFSMRIDAATGLYSLQDANGLVSEERKIRQLVNDYLQQRDYLVQPLLRNESALEAELVSATGLSSERVSTLRVVTSSSSAGIALRLANLERSGADYRRWEMYPVALDTGKAEIEGKLVSLPDWPLIMRLVKTAHTLCADQLTVGWDVVMTSDGPLLLEGNTNWGVQAHQFPPRAAFLSGPMRAVYIIKGTENAH